GDAQILLTRVRGRVVLTDVLRREGYQAFGQRNGRRSDQRLEHRRCCRPRLRPGFGGKGHAEYGGDGHNGCRGTGSSGGSALLLQDGRAGWVLQTFGRGGARSPATN